MGMVIGWCWAAVIASGVWALLAREVRRRRATGDELDVLDAPDPARAAALTFFMGVAAPYLLWKHRGVRGLFEGVGLLLGGALGAALTHLVLAHLHG